MGFTFGPDYSDKDIDEENIDLPDRLDYRELIEFNPIVTQGSCGACAVFSAVFLVENHYFMSKKILKKFSEQQLVNCLYKKKDVCEEGSAVEDVFDYIEDEGLMDYDDYPYVSGGTGKRTKCKYNEKYNTTKINYYKVTKDAEPKNIKKYIYKYGPILALINSECIEDYYEGIVDYSKKECSNKEKNLDHAVTIIGWDVDENGKTYWIVRNSWGDDWGDEGYMYVKYGDNVIGIESIISYINSNFIKMKKFLLYLMLIILF